MPFEYNNLTIMLKKPNYDDLSFVTHLLEGATRRWVCTGHKGMSMVWEQSSGILTWQSECYSRN